MVRLGLGFIVLASPIFIGLAIEKFCGYGDNRRVLLRLVSAFVVLAVTMRFCGVFSGFVNLLLSRKRACEGVSVEESSSEGERKRRRIGAGESAAKRCCFGGGSGDGDRGRVFAMAQRDASSMHIDEDLHSRQLAVYGRDTMRRLFASNVLVSGMQGLGAEIGTFLEKLLVC